MDGYVENVEFCEYDGSFLDENGRCPIEDCVHNLILDVLAGVYDEEATQEDADTEHEEDSGEVETKGAE